MNKPFNLSGVLYVVGLCAVFIAISWYYKEQDSYCRYAAENRPMEDIAPECRDVVAAERAAKK